MPEQKLIVMISSTSRDLGIYREQVESACKGLGMFSLMMEDLPAMDKDAVEVSLEMVDRADVYIGVFAHRYGYIPEGFDKSVTHLEYERAIEKEKPRLIFLIDEDVPVKKSNIDTGVHAQLLDALKQRLLKERVLEFFENPPDLSYKALLSLALFEKEHTEKHASSRNDPLDSQGEHEQIIDLLAGIPEPPEMDLPASPYKGPNRFERKDAWVFFGRSNEIRTLYKALVETWCDPIILYCGESGVGKSSLLEAGVLPRLEQSHGVLYARRDGETGLVTTLARTLDAGPAEIASAWRAKEASTGKPLIVILDQVEEMYTSPVSTEGDAGYSEEKELVELLVNLFKEKNQRPLGRLVLAFRKEWATDIEAALNKASLPWKKIFLERLSVQGVLEVINGPQSNQRLRKKYELDVEPGLPDVMAVEFLKDRQSVVGPALSIVLTKMWDRVKIKSNRVFDEGLFDEMKEEGLQLHDFIEDRLQQLSTWKPDVARTGLFLDVLHYYTTEQDTAESSLIDEVINRYPGREDTVRHFIQWCMQHDLLTRTNSESGEGARLVHDTLAPLIVEKYRASTLPGQRAERILENRLPGWRGGRTGVALDRYGLAEVERGEQGMRGWDEDEKRLVKASRRTRIVRRMQVGGLLGFIVLLGGLMYLNNEQRADDRCEVAGVFSTWCHECQDAGGIYSATDDEDALFCTEAIGFEGLSLEKDFVLIEHGTFLMGSIDSLADDDESPVHEVRIEKDFWMSKTEVTQEQWYAVMETNPSSFKEAKRPVERVSWFDVQTFLDSLNSQIKCAACYRLPTEAEWEYAARAGSTTRYSFGDNPEDLDKYAWYSGNSREFDGTNNPDSTTRPVGTRDSNAWGLSDMHGNVWEWVQDAYEGYPESSVVDLQDGYVTDLGTGSNRVIRGGGWGNSAGLVRSALRCSLHPGFRNSYLGFRVVRTVQ